MKFKKIFLAVTFCCLVGMAQGAIIASAAAPLQKASEFRTSERFQIMQASIDEQYDDIVSDVIRLTETPAPYDGEKKRGDMFADLLKEAGLLNVRRDRAGNILGLRPGAAGGRTIAVIAHLDTVFDKNVSVTVRREGNKLYAPGIGDNSFALAIIPAYIRALNTAGIATDANILFVGSVGEEGLGNLRGVRHLFEEGAYAGKIDSVIVMEPAKPGQVITTSIGSIRYEVTFEGPGGHSFSRFGIVSPAYALASAIAAIGRINVSGEKRTTFNVGVVSGGTSVNSIPFAMSMKVDMRSEDNHELRNVEKQVLDILDRAVEAENATRSTAHGAISVTKKVIGVRPAGHIDPAETLVQQVKAAIETGSLVSHYDAAGTDANIPMSKGIPAVVIGHGVHAEKGHSLQEFVALNRDVDVPNMATALLAILLAAGIAD